MLTGGAVSTPLRFVCDHSVSNLADRLTVGCGPCKPHRANSISQTGGTPSGEGNNSPIKRRLDFRGNRRIDSVTYVAWDALARGTTEATEYVGRKRAERNT